MARLFQIRELEARRQALAAESEVYRQTLLLQVMNLRVASAQARGRMASTVRAWVLVIAPLGGLVALFRHRRGNHQPSRRRGLIGKLMLAFRLYRRFAPVLQPWLVQMLRARRQPTDPEPSPAPQPTDSAGAPPTSKRPL